MKSNVTVGPPIDLLVYGADELEVTRYRRFMEDDPDWQKIRTRWQQALRGAVARLPNLRFRPVHTTGAAAGAATTAEETIEVVEGSPASSESAAELQPQQSGRGQPQQSGRGRPQ